MIRFLFIAVLVCFNSPMVRADEYRPAYLELVQTGEEVFDVLWKVPAKGGNRRLRLKVVFPDDIQTISPVRGSFIARAFVERSTIKREGGLAGARIAINGLERVSLDVLVRIQMLDNTSETARLNSASTWFVVKGSAEFWDVLKTYMIFGITHILGGFDHLLFIACLIFIAGSWRRILVTITGFTLAHSVTLTLGALELLKIPVPPTEAVIALSIVFLAREIAANRRDTLTWRYPIAVSSCFGLLHGLGFASALREVGLPQTEIPTALLAFNVGVEIGQVLFVTAVILILWLLTMIGNIIRLGPVDWQGKIEKPSAYAVGTIAMFWTVERIAGFWI